MSSLIELLPKISYKQKLFLNMIISQTGFLSLSLAILLFDASAATIIFINILFAIIIAYLNWAAYQRINSGLDTFNKKMTQLVDFSFMKINQIKKIDYVQNNEVGFILKELESYEEKFDKTRKSDMQVLGEVVLILNKMSRGVYKCRVKAHSDNFMIQALRDTINKTLDISQQNMNELKDTLYQYAHDDYTKQVKIDPHLQEDMLDMMKSVNLLGNSLNQSAKNNYNYGEQLNSNAVTMTDSVNNLANKANQQAASLEETTAAVEKITSITRNNTKNASKMSQLGSQVKLEVSNGMDLATKTSKAMDSINEQVTAINEAITVIDQIAFQTNILSLNAAVEAATAGEAGKGFAVVAQEVRNLASRSAEAAKQITDVVNSIQESVSLTNQKFDSMTKSIDNIYENTNSYSDTIGGVFRDSQETFKGLEHITDRIFMSLAKLDHVIWKVNTYLSVAHKEPAFKFVDHRNCRLGKWYNEGMGKKYFSATPSYSKLDRPHSVVHNGTHHVFDVIEKTKDDIDYQELMSAFKEMEDASGDVFKLLDQILHERG